jgi:hypothetical protein
MEANVNPAVESENRRRAQRVRTFKGGRIILNRGYSVFDCLVRNLSETGAMLVLSDPFGVPSHFDLEMDAAKARRPCTVRWRTDTAVGVSFDDADSIAA